VTRENRRDDRSFDCKQSAYIEATADLTGLYKIRGRLPPSWGWAQLTSRPPSMRATPLVSFRKQSNGDLREGAELTGKLGPRGCRISRPAASSTGYRQGSCGSIEGKRQSEVVFRPSKLPCSSASIDRQDCGKRSQNHGHFQRTRLPRALSQRSTLTGSGEITRKSKRPTTW